VDLTSWWTKIADDSNHTVEACEIETVDTVGKTVLHQQQQQLYDGGILTIGCCGMPLFCLFVGWHIVLVAVYSVLSLVGTLFI